MHLEWPFCYQISLPHSHFISSIGNWPHLHRLKRHIWASSIAVATSNLLDTSKSSVFGGICVSSLQLGMRLRSSCTLWMKVFVDIFASTLERWQKWGERGDATEVPGKGRKSNCEHCLKHRATVTPHICGQMSRPPPNMAWGSPCAFWLCSLLYLKLPASDHMTQGAFNAKCEQGLIILRLTFGC